MTSATITLAILLSACAMGGDAKALAARLDQDRVLARQEGVVSWYGYEHLGRKTANGERFDPHKMTAAHRKLPFGTIVRVTRLDNGRAVVVRINDRGPFKRGRIIDVSREAAKQLDLIDRGLAQCKVEVLEYPDRATAAR